MILGRTKSHFKVRAVHGIPGLKYNHFPPAHFTKEKPKLFGSVSQVAKIVVLRQFLALHTAADVNRTYLLQKESDAGVLLFGRAINARSFSQSVRSPDVLHCEHRQHDPLLIAQGDLITQVNLPGESLANVQYHGDRPERPVLQTGLDTDSIVILSYHESPKRIEASVEHQFQVAGLPRC